MWLSIVENRSGEELLLRRLGPNASLELRDYVTQWAAESYDMRPSFSEPGSWIPNGCADYQAEIRRTKRSDGFSCWTSEPFYLESEESADG